MRNWAESPLHLPLFIFRDWCPQAPQVEHMAKTTSNGGRCLHILLAENNPFQQLMIGHMLRQLGHTVTISGDGFETLSALQRDRCYDVLLISCHLPLMDGIAATKFIRSAEPANGTHLPIIGMSATASPDICFNAGMDDFIRKPVQKLLLKAILGRWLREKNEHNANRTSTNSSALLLVGALIAMTWLEMMAPLQAQTRTPRMMQSGIASWYGRPFHGRRTASGQIYDMNKLTAAHPTLPLSCEVLVVNPRNGRKVILKVTDRGPFVKNRVLDLSRAAANRLGILSCGVAKVNYTVISNLRPKNDN